MARRGENIYQRKDGRWEGRYIADRRENGQAHYVSVYGSTYRDVKKKLDKRKLEKNAGRKPCDITVEILCLQWLDQVRNTVKESSYARYEHQIKQHIVPILGKLRADALTANVLSQFINSKLKRGRLDGKGGLSPRTVQTLTVLIKSIMKLAGQMYSIQDQTALVKLPKAEQKEIQVLDGDGLRRLERHLRAEPNNSNAGMLLCLYTGLRLGEVCALRWSDIDWKSEVLHVRRTVQRLPRREGGEGARTCLTLTMPKTQRAERMIPLPASLIRYLRSMAQEQDTEAFLLTGNAGCFMDPRTYQYRFQSLLKSLGIQRITFHGLRHTFATQCIQRGVDVKSLSEILGHATVEMTLNRYVHSSLEVKRRQMEHLDFVS